MLGRLTREVVRRRWTILVGCLLATALSAVVSRGLFGRLGYSVFYDPDAESTRAAALAREQFGASDPDVLALYRLPPGAYAAEGMRDPAVRAALARTFAELARDPQVANVLSDVNVPGDRFTSRDGRGAYAVISLRGDPRAKASALPRLRTLLDVELPPASAGAAPIATAPRLGGLVPSGRALTGLAASSLARGERIALPIAGLLLVVLFGSVAAALVPLALGGLSILLTLGILELLSRVAPVDAFAVNVVSILGLGVAIDYALFVISRYREERVHDPEHALVRAVETAGRSVLFSGVTVAASLAGLLVFPQPFLRSVALGGIVVVLLAATLALVVLPAALAILGRRLEWGRLRRAPLNGRAGESAGWRRLAAAVIRRPIVVCLAVTAGLLVLAAPFPRLQPSRADVRSLPRGEEARQVGELLARDFPSAALTPISIVVAMDGDVLDDDRLAELYDYVERLKRLPDVARVESVLSFAGARDRAAAEALAPRLEAYASAPPSSGRVGIGAVLHGRYALVRVVPTVPPDSPRGQRQVVELRALAPPPASRALAFGQAPALHDFAAGLRARAPRMLAVVGLAMFVVLLLAFRSVVLPLKAMLMTALSLTASFGAIVFVFQDGRLQRLLGYESLGTIDASLPVVMFAVVFGLSMDYEVLILGRIREAYRRSGRNRAAVVEGLAQTGRLVTGAALLMVVVFSAFAAAPLVFVKALGLGMALAVALDATVVRMLLVPSTMALLGRLNWWLPGPRRA